jgi:antitoxin HicB
LKKSLRKEQTKIQDNFQDKLEYYLSLKFPYTVEESDEEGRKIYILSFPDLPGCWSEGENFEEAHQKLEEARKAWIWASLGEGLPIPEPAKEDEFSGKFLLRISPKLHMILSKNSEREGKSLNQHIRSILEAKVNQDNMQGFSDLLTTLKTWMIEEFTILSQRLNSLEVSFNNISDSIRLSQQRPFGNYGFTVGQTDAMEIPSQVFQINQSNKIYYGKATKWAKGQAFQKEQEDTA